MNEIMKMDVCNRQFNPIVPIRTHTAKLLQLLIYIIARRRIRVGTKEVFKAGDSEPAGFVESEVED